jgi:2-hydroxychromene-2-carboxylate isomerase
MNSSLLARRVKTEKPMRPVLDFFFFYGSIYTYLSVMRIEKLATAAGLEVRWCPFNLREILIEQDNTAFTRNLARMSYCWRDVQRRAARHGLDFVSRPPYPVDAELLALRVGVIAANEGWCPRYSRATFGNWFIDHKVTGLPDHVSEVLARVGQPAGEILARASSAEADRLLNQTTKAARDFGVFGSPSFVVQNELFWGDDRLEEAIEFCQSRFPD